LEGRYKFGVKCEKVVYIKSFVAATKALKEGLVDVLVQLNK
jgi:hypothetical protein